MATLNDIENCYRYILGRRMNGDELRGARETADSLAATDVDSLRETFLRSPEFHSRHLETLFENLVPHSVTVAFETTFGFRIYLDLRQLHLTFGILYGGYERREVELMRAVVPLDGVFLDVGANVGYFSLAVAARPGFSGKVHAFEPLPPVYGLFERSVIENDLQDRIVIQQMALANAPGMLSVTNAESSINVGGTRLDFEGRSPNAFRKVRVETLDHVSCDFAPDVIKMDVEGAEALCLDGGVMTIAGHRPTLLVEINPELLRLMSGIPAGHLRARLCDFGYDLWGVQVDRLETISSEADLIRQIPASGLLNVFCVHRDRRRKTETLLPELRK
jgi:FkbM family methyltransferase